jgi:hypothetical protein
MSICKFISRKGGYKCTAPSCSSIDVYCARHKSYIKYRDYKKTLVVKTVDSYVDMKPLAQDIQTIPCAGKITIRQALNILQRVFKNKEIFSSELSVLCYEAIETDGAYINREQWTSILSAHAYLTRHHPSNYSQYEWNIIWRGE